MKIIVTLNKEGELAKAEWDSQSTPVLEQGRGQDALRQLLMAVAGQTGSLQADVLDPYLELTQDMNNKLINTQRTLTRSLMQSEAANQAKKEFLARMSHDMRTPINAIVGFNELMRQQLETAPDDAQTKQLLQYLGYSKQAAEFLLALITDILDIAKLEKGTLVLQEKAFDLQAAVQAVYRMVKPQMEAQQLHYTFTNQIPEHAWYVADEVRLKQVLMNLLNNAAKFTPAGGSITLTAALLKHTPAGDTFSFSIRDTGIGMSPEFQKNMFRPFEQEHSDARGAGLGLSIAQQIVTRMQGKITVQSELNKGTEFVVQVTLPVAATVQAAAAANGPVDFSGCTFLVCDDNAMNRLILRKLLENKHARITEAANGKEALNLFAGNPPGTFAAILMDILMPVMGGIEAVTTLRKLDRADAKTVPVIAISGNVGEEDQAASRAAGMCGHLAKPIETAELYRLLQKIVAEKMAPAPKN
jgi:signal transduction histidine kinase/ActR/RegA family two-component response regulator